MSDVLADTHAILWYLLEPSRLSAPANAALAQAEQSGGKIYVSAMTVAETVYLYEQGKVPLLALSRLIADLKDPKNPLMVIPLDLAVSESIQIISANQVPDFTSRVLGATAMVHRLPLVTQDPKLRAALPNTVW